MLAALTAAVLVALLVPAAAIDVHRRAIPNRLTLAGALAAIVLAAATADVGVVAERLLAGAAAGGFLLAAALARPGAMGMGDVKLAGVLGLFLGPSVAVAMLVALVLGTIAGLALAARGGIARARRATLPFGPCLALGGVTALLVGDGVVAAYLGA